MHTCTLHMAIHNGQHGEDTTFGLLSVARFFPSCLVHWNVFSLYPINSMWNCPQPHKYLLQCTPTNECYKKGNKALSFSVHTKSSSKNIIKLLSISSNLHFTQFTRSFSTKLMLHRVRDAFLRMLKTISYKINSFDVFVTRNDGHINCSRLLWNRLSVFGHSCVESKPMCTINTSWLSYSVRVDIFVTIFLFFALCTRKNKNDCHICVCPASCTVYTNPGSQFPLVKIFVFVCFFLPFGRSSCRTKRNACCIVAVLLNFCDDKILEHKRFYVCCTIHGFIAFGFNAIAVAAAVSTGSLSRFISITLVALQFVAAFVFRLSRSLAKWRVYFGDSMVEQ